MHFIKKLFSYITILIFAAIAIFFIFFPNQKYEQDNTIILFNSFTQKYFAMEYYQKENDTTYYISSKSKGYYHRVESKNDNYTKYRIVYLTQVNEKEIYSCFSEKGKFDFWNCLVAFYKENTIKP